MCLKRFLRVGVYAAWPAFEAVFFAPGGTQRYTLQFHMTSESSPIRMNLPEQLPRLRIPAL